MRKLIAKIAELIGWIILGLFALMSLCLIVPGGFVLVAVLVGSEQLNRWTMGVYNEE